MYEKFYGLREPAFNLTPDPHFLFLTQRSKAALQHLLYAIERREAFALIVGDVGTGKTTLCWALLEKLEGKKVRTALVQNPMLSEIEILRSILQDLGVRKDVMAGDANAWGQTPVSVFDSSWMLWMSKKELIDRLNSFLAEQAQQDYFTVIIIDEAQNLSLEMLEQLRLLSNLETAKKKLLQIIFVGQLELLDKLRLNSLRQLNQRISVRFKTSTLSRDDTERYVFHRLAKAGGAIKVRFGRGAFKAVYHYSKGYPRLINLICDRALLAGYSQRSMVITRKMVLGSARSLEGKEDVSVRIRLPRLAMRRMIITASVLLLILLLSFLVWKGVVRLNVPAFLSSSTVTGAPPPPPAGQAPAIAVGVPATPMPESKAAEPPGLSPQPAAAPTPPIEAKKKIDPQYYLQVYSFRTDSQAKAALAELQNAGYPSLSRLSTKGAGAGWFGVYVGPFEDLDSARQNVSRLRRRTRVSPVLRVLEFQQAGGHGVMN